MFELMEETRGAVGQEAMDSHAVSNDFLKRTEKYKHYFPHFFLQRCFSNIIHSNDYIQAGPLSIQNHPFVGNIVDRLGFKKIQFVATHTAYCYIAYCYISAGWAINPTHTAVCQSQSGEASEQVTLCLPLVFGILVTC